MSFIKVSFSIDPTTHPHVPAYPVQAHNYRVYIFIHVNNNYDYCNYYEKVEVSGAQYEVVVVSFHAPSTSSYICYTEGNSFCWEFVARMLFDLLEHHRISL